MVDFYQFLEIVVNLILEFNVILIVILQEAILIGIENVVFEVEYGFLVQFCFQEKGKYFECIEKKVFM